MKNLAKVTCLMLAFAALPAYAGAPQPKTWTLTKPAGLEGGPRQAEEKNSLAQTTPEGRNPGKKWELSKPARLEGGPRLAVVAE
jgi:hypothetical protein